MNSLLRFQFWLLVCHFCFLAFLVSFFRWSIVARTCLYDVRAEILQHRGRVGSETGTPPQGCRRWPESSCWPRDGTVVASQLLGKAELAMRSEEHTSELQSRLHLVCRT